MHGTAGAGPQSSGLTQRTSPWPCAPTRSIPPRPRRLAPPQWPAMPLKMLAPNSTPRTQTSCESNPQTHLTPARAAVPAPSGRPKTMMGPERKAFPTPTQRPSVPVDTPADTPCAPQLPSTLKPPLGGLFAMPPERPHILLRTRVTTPAPLTW